MREEWINCLKQLQKSVTICFINVFEDYRFWHEDLGKYFTPIRIKKEKINDNIFDPLREEMVFIFTKDNMVRESARHFTHEKILTRVGVKLLVEELSVSQLVDINHNIIGHKRLEEIESIQAELIKLNKENQALSKVIQSLAKSIIDSYVKLEEDKKGDNKQYKLS